jgi:hypothetical protein
VNSKLTKDRANNIWIEDVVLWTFLGECFNRLWNVSGLQEMKIKAG